MCRERVEEVRGGDSENHVEIQREREGGVAEIPGETDKTVSFIEDAVYVAARCNAMLTFLPIPGAPRGSTRPAGGICLVDQTCQCFHKAGE